MSTGIGTDNIDIVMNELDALFNIDLKTRTVKGKHTSLNIVRIGTSGSLQANIPVNSVIVSEQAIGLDSLMLFYDRNKDEKTEESIKQQLGFGFLNPYVENASEDLINIFSGVYKLGITATCCGFYAPQGRFLKAGSAHNQLIKKLNQIKIGTKQITNFEMETAGIYGMANVLGHQAVSINCILANRITNDFSKNPNQFVEKTIKEVLALLVK
jgi:uridine phosphorylase